MRLCLSVTPYNNGRSFAGYGWLEDNIICRLDGTCGVSGIGCYTVKMNKQVLMTCLFSVLCRCNLRLYKEWLCHLVRNDEVVSIPEYRPIPTSA